MSRPVITQADGGVTPTRALSADSAVCLIRHADKRDARRLAVALLLFWIGLALAVWYFGAVPVVLAFLALALLCVLAEAIVSTLRDYQATKAKREAETKLSFTASDLLSAREAEADLMTLDAAGLRIVRSEQKVTR